MCGGGVDGHGALQTAVNTDMCSCAHAYSTCEPFWPRYGYEQAASPARAVSVARPRAAVPGVRCL